MLGGSAGIVTQLALQVQQSLAEECQLVRGHIFGFRLLDQFRLSQKGTARQFADRLARDRRSGSYWRFWRCDKFFIRGGCFERGFGRGGFGDYRFGGGGFRRRFTGDLGSGFRGGFQIGFRSDFGDGLGDDFSRGSRFAFGAFQGDFYFWDRL